MQVVLDHVGIVGDNVLSNFVLVNEFNLTKELTNLITVYKVIFVVKIIIVVKLDLANKKNKLAVYELVVIEQRVIVN